MKATVKNTVLAVLIAILSISFSFGQAFETNKSGTWNENNVWSKYEKVKGKNTWVPQTQIGYNFNDNNIEFTVNENDTIILTDNEIVTLTGNNITFNIYGILIINGSITLTKNNTDLVVNGNLIVNGELDINGGGGSSIGGTGTISVSEGGSFNWKGEPIDPSAHSIDIVVGTTTSLCSPYDLQGNVVENGSEYNVKLTWYFNIGASECVDMDKFTHFEIVKNGDIIALVEGLTKSTLFTFTDMGLVAGETPSYSVTAVYSEPARRSSASTTTFSSPLPIELMFFTAEAANEVVNLNWATATEINNDFFTIERSLDGSTWEIVDFLTGAGNSNYMIEYTFTDANPYQGVSYYRLKQTDYDGKFEYFAPVAVNMTKSAGSSEIVNVTFNSSSMDVWFQNEQESTMLLVADLQGRIISQQTLNSEDFVQNVKVNFPRNYNGEVVMVRLVSAEKSDERKYMIR